jgi:hypothetical protein
MRAKQPFSDAKRNRQWRKLDRMLSALERGVCDHLFRDTETKQYAMADIKQEMGELVRAEMLAFPGLYRELPNNRWALAEPNVFPLPCRKP